MLAVTLEAAGMFTCNRLSSVRTIRVIAPQQRVNMLTQKRRVITAD
jgi:hypothetical protein